MMTVSTFLNVVGGVTPDLGEYLRGTFACPGCGAALVGGKLPGVCMYCKARIQIDIEKARAEATWETKLFC